MLRRLRLLYEKGGGYGGSSSSSGMFGLGSLASKFNIFTPLATPRYPSARKRPAPETADYAQRPKSEPGRSSKAPSISSAVAFPVKPETAKAGSVKSERAKSESGSGVPNLYFTKVPSIKDEAVKKSGSVKSAKKSSAAGSAAQRSGMMALPVGNEPFEGPSPGGSTTSSARLRRNAVRTLTELRTPASSLKDFHIGSAKAASLSGSRQPSVVSVHSSKKSGR